MGDLARDSLQEFLDERFPGGASVVLQRTSFPFTTASLSTVPRVLVLADGLVTFQLETSSPLLTLESMEATDVSVVLTPKGFSAAFVFQTPPAQVVDDLALEREVNWSDVRLTEERDWYESWRALEEAG